MTSFLKNDLVWVPCNIDGYKLMKVENVDIVGGKLLVKDHRIDDNDNCCLPRSESVSIELCSKYVSDTDKDDNTALTSLDPANILENIRFRFAKGKIYTSTAHLLLAMNPYREIENLYSQETKRSYYGKHISQMPPHPYSIADSSYRSMVLDKKKHAIVISGESGAGKTETAKIVMSYLAEVGILPSKNELTESEFDNLTDKQKKRLIQIRLSYSSNEVFGEDESKRIQKRILSANPILEAFGNARTVRNYNSSRFGRLNKMYYNEHGFLRGGGITTYLLESSRCVKHNHNERSYHCFYQLIHGCSDHELKEYYLERNVCKYKLLNQGNLAYNSEIENDKKQFLVLRESFGVNGIDKDMQISLFKILSGIILLGNIEFKSNNSSNDNLNDSNNNITSSNDGAKLEFEDEVLIENISDLFSIEKGLLSEVLLVKQLRIGNNQSSVSIPRTSNQSIQLIHSIIRSIYMRLFNWMVFQINQFTSCKDDIDLNSSSPSRGNSVNNSLYIGILDIYGFEKLEINSFEQLCINLANEKLQEFFVEKVLQSEQKLYKQEGLIWKNIDIPKTQPVLDLIFDIFSLLDDDSRLKSQGQDRSDYTYWQRINNKYGKSMNNNSGISGSNNCSLSLSSPSKCYNDSNLQSLQKLIKFPLNGLKMNSNELNTKFVIKHYAGSVEYTLNGWLDKNHDKIIPELEELLYNSKNSILNGIIDEEYKNRKSASFRSVSKKFTKDLKDMIQDLGEISLQFIRCFIPNNNMRSDEWNGHLVLNQMMQSGTVQMVKIMHYGYPNRACYSNLIKQLRCLLPEKYIYGFSDRMIVEFFLSTYNIPSKTYQFGISKLFLKSGQYGLLLDQISDYTNGNYDNGLVLPDENVLIDLRKKFVNKCFKRCVMVADIVSWLKNRFIKLIKIRKNINMLLCMKIFRWYLFYKFIMLPLRKRISNRMPYILCNKLLNRIMKSGIMKIKVFVFRLLKLNVQAYNKIMNNNINNSENNKKLSNNAKDYKHGSDDDQIKKINKSVREDNIFGMNSDSSVNKAGRKSNILENCTNMSDQGLVGLEIWKQELFSFIGFRNNRKYNYIVHYDGNNVCLLEIYGEKVKTYELFVPILDRNSKIDDYLCLDTIKFINTDNSMNIELNRIEKDIRNINFNDDDYNSENSSSYDNSNKCNESDSCGENNTYYSEYKELDTDLCARKVEYDVGNLLCLSQHPTFNTSFALISDNGSISIFRLDIEVYSEESPCIDNNEYGNSDYWDIINSTPSTKLPNLGCDLSTVSDSLYTGGDKSSVSKSIKSRRDKSIFSLKGGGFHSNVKSANSRLGVYTECKNGERKTADSIPTISICSNVTFDEYMPSEWTRNGDIFVPLRVHFIDSTSYQYLGILWHVEYSEGNIKKSLDGEISYVRLEYPESIKCFRNKKRSISESQYYNNDMGDECTGKITRCEDIVLYDGLFTIVDLSTNEIIEWLNFPFKLSKIVEEWSGIGEGDNNHLTWNKVSSYHPKCWCNLFGFAMSGKSEDKSEDGCDKGPVCSSSLIYDVIPTADVLKETCFLSSEKVGIFKTGEDSGTETCSSSKECNTVEEYLVFIGGPRLGLILSFEAQTQKNEELLDTNMYVLYDMLKLNKEIESGSKVDLASSSGHSGKITSEEFKNILENSTWFTTSLWVKGQNGYSNGVRSSRLDSSILINSRLSSSLYSNNFGINDVTLLLGAINGRIISLNMRKKQVVKVTLISPFEVDSRRLPGDMRSSSIVSMFCVNDTINDKITCMSSTGDMVTINLSNISAYNNNNNLVYSDKLHICLEKKYRPFIVQFLIFNSSIGPRNIIDSKLTQSFVFLDAVEKNLVIYNKNLGVTRPIATIT